MVLLRTGIFEGGHLKMATAPPVKTQELSTAYLREIFKNLESGNGRGFFDHVADNGDWTVEGTHPLAWSLSQQGRVPGTYL
jgi:hypothetical protein